MTDTLTPVEMANRMLDRARIRDPHNPLLSKLEALRNEIAEQARERGNLERRLAQMRLIVDEQAHRIQGGIDRIAELEAERDLAAIDTALRNGHGRVDLTVSYGTEDGQAVFTVLLVDDGPECEDVMGPMPGDGRMSVLASGQAPTLAEALMKCAAQKVGA